MSWLLFILYFCIVFVPDLSFTFYATSVRFPILLNRRLYNDNKGFSLIIHIAQVGKNDLPQWPFQSLLVQWSRPFDPHTGREKTFNYEASYCSGNAQYNILPYPGISQEIDGQNQPRVCMRGQCIDSLSPRGITRGRVGWSIRFLFYCLL